MVMPTFMMVWVKMSPAQPAQKSRPRSSLAVQAICRSRSRSRAKAPSSAAPPTKPNSSLMTEKMKSLCAAVAGRKPSSFCVPGASQPFPLQPPLPMAMSD